MWIDGTDKTMAGRIGVVLNDQTESQLQGRNLAPQPSEHSPHGHVIEGSFVDDRLFLWRQISNHAVGRTNGPPVRLPIVVEIASGEMKKRLTGVAFIREYENRGSR